MPAPGNLKRLENDKLAGGGVERLRDAVVGFKTGDVDSCEPSIHLF